MMLPTVLVLILTHLAAVTVGVVAIPTIDAIAERRIRRARSRRINVVDLAHARAAKAWRERNRS